MVNPTTRHAIERAIQIEEDDLSCVANNINNKTPWSAWGIRERKAFALAVLPPAPRRPALNKGSASLEHGKARHIIDHLAVNDDVLSDLSKLVLSERVAEDRQIRRSAERIRADIMGVIRPWRIDFGDHHADDPLSFSDIQEDSDTL